MEIDMDMGSAGPWHGGIVRTIGHGSRTKEELVELLKLCDASLLCDVRTVPRSRRNPQFNKSESFIAVLASHGIEYRHNKKLGGLRKPKGQNTIPAAAASCSSSRSDTSSSSSCSRNDVLKTEQDDGGLKEDGGLRGFIEYMDSDGFRVQISSVVEATRSGGRCVVMCAEVAPWRCHRLLIADALVARGVHVTHLIVKGKELPHKLSPGCMLSPIGEVRYPLDDLSRWESGMVSMWEEEEECM